MPEIELTAQATTVLPVLRILQPNDSYMNDGDVVVRIERDSDGLIFDANNTDAVQRTFKPDAQCQNPWIPLKRGSTNASGRLESSIKIDPAIFKDGDYVVNFHDNRFPTKVIFGMDSIYIYLGKPNTPRPFQDYEIAIRVIECKMAAHKIAGTLGAMINNMNDRLTRVEQKIDRIIAKLGA